MAIKPIIKKCFTRMARMWMKHNFLPKEIIIKMDGGICSQMHFYLIGVILAGKGNSVSFDLKWFDTTGTDLDGRFCRNFDLQKMFPTLHFRKIGNNLIRRIYISAFYHYNDYFGRNDNMLAWTGLKAPAYLDGYFKDPEEMYSTLFRKIFRIDTDVLDNKSHETLRIIEDAKESGYETCAVHVRRGDLSRYNRAYGDPASIRYFRDSFDKVSSAATAENVRFFIFSDEPEWCRKGLLPTLGGRDINICDANGSDKGYCDLILMSRCRHQITSQGSMGKYAALLREEHDLTGLVTLPPNEGAETWVRRYVSAIII